MEPSVTETEKVRKGAADIDRKVDLELRPVPTAELIEGPKNVSSGWFVIHAADISPTSSRRIRLQMEVFKSFLSNVPS